MMLWSVWLLAGCGVQEPMMQPNPPPEPASLKEGADADEVTVSGTVSAVSAETRSWVQVGDGQTVIGHLPPTGVLTIEGRAALAGDLAVGMTITAHGHQAGDLVIIVDAQATPSASASSDAQAAAADAEGLADPTAPDAADGAAPSAASPAAASAPDAASPAAASPAPAKPAAKPARRAPAPTPAADPPAADPPKP